MLYLSNLQPAFETSETSSSSGTADPDNVAFQLLELTNHIPPAYLARPDFITTTTDPEDPDWVVLDVDELPRPEDLR